MKKTLWLAGIALTIALPCSAEVPVRAEQTVWTILSSNGFDYSPTFIPESSDTLYLIADSDNFLAARKTLVYWWPITSEWKTDPQSLNIQFDGELELRDTRGKPSRIPQQEYTYFNVRGEYELNWQIATGDDARVELEKYEALYDSFFKATQDYQRESLAFDAEMQSLAARIGDLKKEGRDYSTLLDRMKTLPRPTPPSAPSYYEVPPAGMQQAFILNLPKGRYTIHLINSDGSILEGSEKSVVVHSASDRKGIGYSVMPSDKWTRPVDSVTPSSVLYVNGKADLYIRPFFESEYNDLHYSKTVDNAASGNPSMMRWVHIQQVPKATIHVRRRGTDDSVVPESPYLVEQSKGSGLGYTIRSWDPESDKDKTANLIAFRIPMNESDRVINIVARDSGGKVLPGSERRIRVVRASPLAHLLTGLSFLPLLVVGLTLIRRKDGDGIDTR